MCATKKFHGMALRYIQYIASFILFLDIVFTFQNIIDFFHEISDFVNDEIRHNCVEAKPLRFKHQLILMKT